MQVDLVSNEGEYICSLPQDSREIGFEDVQLFRKVTYTSVSDLMDVNISRIREDGSIAMSLTYSMGEVRQACLELSRIKFVCYIFRFTLSQINADTEEVMKIDTFDRCVCLCIR